jgi:hypothetical protein
VAGWRCGLPVPVPVRSYVICICTCIIFIVLCMFCFALFALLRSTFTQLESTHTGTGSFSIPHVRRAPPLSLKALFSGPICRLVLSSSSFLFFVSRLFSLSLVPFSPPFVELRGARYRYTHMLGLLLAPSDMPWAGVIPTDTHAILYAVIRPPDRPWQVVLCLRTIVVSSLRRFSEPGSRSPAAWPSRRLPLGCLTGWG